MDAVKPEPVDKTGSGHFQAKTRRCQQVAPGLIMTDHASSEYAKPYYE
jgi:hypothetical protein